ncbi:hypothetical protein [Novosphingobium sp.]|uniref:hypothetical protein n=1 Tax=Novosphingobium sp. TaxID=1874826 RepID=UPI001D292BCE|nr:hypothetical protein [Novosphingobium sp.]MBX9664710.1 hypothetical protein [Novosphingobium sp.]
MCLPFTPRRRVRFLNVLATTGNVRRACHEVGVSPQSAYVHKRRDAAFAHGWNAALILARDAAEEVLAERALHGVSETIFYRGEAVGSRTRFDARLLLAHLARLDAHATRAEAELDPAPGIAARFDDYLAELLDAGETGADPVFEPPIHEFDQPPQWTPATPTREEALRAAREEVLRAFPTEVADLPPEATADIDLDEADEDDVLDAALAEAQHTAEVAAAEAWDTQQETRLATLEALFAGEPDAAEDPLHFCEAQMASDLKDPPHFCEAQMASDPTDPPHFCEAQMGRGTTEGGGGANPPHPEEQTPAEPPIETKSAKLPQDRVNPVNRRGLIAARPPLAFMRPSAAHRAGGGCR